MFTAVEAVDRSAAQFCSTDDDRLVLAEGTTHRLFLLDADGGKPKPVDESFHQVGYRVVAASPVPPTRFVAADHDRLMLFTFDGSGKRLAPDQDLPRLPDDVVVAVWSPDGAQIACGSRAGV